MSLGCWGCPTVSRPCPASCPTLLLNRPHPLQERRALERKAAELEEELKVSGPCKWPEPRLGAQAAQRYPLTPPCS